MGRHHASVWLGVQATDSTKLKQLADALGGEILEGYAIFRLDIPEADALSTQARKMVDQAPKLEG